MLQCGTLPGFGDGVTAFGESPELPGAFPCLLFIRRNEPAVSFISAGVVATSGIVGWVGLVIPHIARTLVGPDHGRLLPVSALIGAIYLLLVDDVARTATVAELPIGIITALIGVPVFALILRRTQSRSGWAHD